MSTPDLTDEEKALLAAAEQDGEDGLTGNLQAPGLAKSDSDGPVSDNRMREATAEPGELAPQEEGAKKPRARRASREAPKETPAASVAADPSTPAQYGEGAEPQPAQYSYDE